MPPRISDEVDRLLDERPGKVLLTPVYDDQAIAINDFIYQANGATAGHMVVTDAGRVIINPGLCYEGPHRRWLYDRVCKGPTPYIITTQAHADHVGAVAAFREPGTTYVAHANNRREQAEDARIRPHQQQRASLWFDIRPARAKELAALRPDVPATQDRPTPDLTFDTRLAFSVGTMNFELYHGVGETTDGAIVWLPQHRIAFIGNILGPLFCHFPNLNTLRGQQYRHVEPYLATIRRIRELRPEMLITGRGEPIVGANLIDACLQRQHDAVTYVHQATLEGINNGIDLATLIRDVKLPPELRVGQGYGKVSWGVRTIWETYLGWFQNKHTTELYPVDRQEILTDLVALAGKEKVLGLARNRMREDRPVEATALGEAVLAHSPGDPDATDLLVDAHRALLKDPEAEANFWLSGWLEHQIDVLTATADEARDFRS